MEFPASVKCWFIQFGSPPRAEGNLRYVVSKAELLGQKHKGVLIYNSVTRSPPAATTGHALARPGGDEIAESARTSQLPNTPPIKL